MFILAFILLYYFSTSTTQMILLGIISPSEESSAFAAVPQISDEFGKYTYDDSKYEENGSVQRFAINGSRTRCRILYKEFSHHRVRT